LSLNDDLFGFNGSLFDIAGIKPYSENAKVYNLTVNNDHTFFVGESRVLSHNAGECNLGDLLIKTGKLKKLDDKYLKREGIDAHAAKKLIMGSGKRNARFDMVIDKGSKKVFLKSKEGKLIDSTYSLEELKLEAAITR